MIKGNICWNFTDINDSTTRCPEHITSVTIHKIWRFKWTHFWKACNRYDKTQAMQGTSVEHHQRLPVEGIEDLYDNEHRQCHCLGFWVIKHSAVYAWEHPWLSWTLHVVGLSTETLHKLQWTTSSLWQNFDSSTLQVLLRNWLPLWISY